MKPGPKLGVGKRAPRFTVEWNFAGDGLWFKHRDGRASEIQGPPAFCAALLASIKAKKVKVI